VPQVLIALGSNVGDRLHNLRRAVAALTNSLEIQRTSKVYETAPMYVEDQGAFYNAALAAQTELSPVALLSLLKATEEELGREQRMRNGPREIDLDLIAYGQIQYEFWDRGKLRLKLPHPRTPERRFVLQPLYDLDPDINLAGQGMIKKLLVQTDDQASSVHTIDHADLSL
jgi:2-amino-4-hydroxy-6-hydroxymethyldihydropteridine diphosphokinase